MSTKAGQLLWRRMHLTFPPSTSFVTVDTGITQVNLADDPPLGFEAPDVASRVQVIPMAPLAGWNQIAHTEPVVNPATGTVEITFYYNGAIPEPPTPYQIPPLNVLIWDPHTLVGPGQADTYLPPQV